jgi:hypothetical protein
MNGRQLIDHALARRPTLRILFMTGYARVAIVHDGRSHPKTYLFRGVVAACEIDGGSPPSAGNRERDGSRMNSSEATTKSFLLVQDEALIRMMMAGVLQQLSHSVSVQGPQWRRRCGRVLRRLGTALLMGPLGYPFGPARP